jgi:hypothetical protein
MFAAHIVVLPDRPGSSTSGVPGADPNRWTFSRPNPVAITAASVGAGGRAVPSA